MRRERQVGLLQRVVSAGPTMKGLESGALPEVVDGRNEAPLIHLHRSVNEAPAAGGCGSDS